MTGATSGAGTAYPFGGNPSLPLLFRRIRVTWSLVFCVVFCRSLFVLLFFFFWALCCLSFFDLQILITSLWYLQTLLIQKQVIFMCTKFDIYVFIKSYFIIIPVVIWRILEYRYMYTQFFFLFSSPRWAPVIQSKTSKASDQWIFQFLFRYTFVYKN
jgi:hypothetical protein